MWPYITKRLLLIVPTLIGIVFINFLVLQFVPGGPVERMLSQLRAHQQGGEAGAAAVGVGAGRMRQASLDQEQVDYLTKLYGFDEPAHVQFLRLLRRLFTFDFGDSFYHHKRVLDLVLEKLPVSVSLGGWSFCLVYLVCVPLGIRKAVRDGTPFDNVSSIVVMVAFSIPGFVLGIFLIVLLGGGSFLSVFPLRGLTSDGWEQFTAYERIMDYLWHLVLPLISYAIGSFYVLTMFTKNSFLNEVHHAYVQTARAKGLSERVVLFKHVFRNAMIPIILGFPGGFLAMFFAGSILIETVFSLDGIGLLSYESVINRDYPVVMSTLFLFSMLALIAQLLSDLSLVLVDPRISFESVPR